uniref:Uncharacterized protein n=1 Tax=Anguilla anguilla TaxID=7936 RepID=A0A0E9S6L4_ANGAN
MKTNKLQTKWPFQRVGGDWAEVGNKKHGADLPSDTLLKELRPLVTDSSAHLHTSTR